MDDGAAETVGGDAAVTKTAVRGGEQGVEGFGDRMSGDTDDSSSRAEASAEGDGVGQSSEGDVPASEIPESPEAASRPDDGSGAVRDVARADDKGADSVEGADDADGEDPEAEGGEEEAEPVLPDGAYFVRSAADPSFVLDVADASVVSGADVRLWSANESNAQRFWVSSEDGVYRLQAMCSGKALAVEEGGLENGADVQQWLLEEASVEQTWEASENDDGTFTLVSCANDLALDVADGLAFEGADVRTWEQNGTVAQRFVFEPAEAFRDGVYTIPSTIDMGMVVDVPTFRAMRA